MENDPYPPIIIICICPAIPTVFIYEDITSRKKAWERQLRGVAAINFVLGSQATLGGKAYIDFKFRLSKSRTSLEVLFRPPFKVEN
jgi:hypothetical protein